MKNARVYVGNFPFSVTPDDLRSFFAPRNIVDIKVCTDRETGRPRGFGFVEFATEAEANDAIQIFNGTDMGGRDIVVSVANDRDSRVSGGRPAPRGQQAPGGAPSRGIPLRAQRGRAGGGSGGGKGRQSEGEENRSDTEFWRERN